MNLDDAQAKVGKIFGPYADKALHALGGAVIGVGGLFVVWASAHIGVWIVAVLAAAIGGLAVECYQLLRHEGVFSWWDAAATAVGGAVISLLVLLFLR